MRGRSRRWQNALLAGSHGLAVFRYQVEVYGGEYSRWRSWADGEKGWAMFCLNATAFVFVEKHGLDPELAKAWCVRDQRVYALVWEMVMHLAHWRLGRPFDWRSRKEEFFMGTMENAQAELARQLARRRKWGLLGEETLRSRRRNDALRASLLRDENWTIGEIAKNLDKSKRTVYELLREAEEMGQK